MPLIPRDLRRFLPAHRRGRVVGLLAILSLALGIAGNAVFFSWVNTFLFEPLPYPDADRLVLLGESREGRRTLAMVSMFTSLATWDDLREWSRTLEDWTALSYGLRSLSRGDRSESVFVGRATPGLLGTMRVEPVRGRGFAAEDGREGAPGVVLASWDFWMARGGPRSGLLDSELLLDGEPHRVVGILPEGFEILVDGVDLWTPLQADPTRWSRGGRSLITLARMPYGVDMEAVRAEVAALSADLQAEHPEAMDGWEMRAYHFETEIPDPQSPLHLTIMQGLVLLVLLIVCANVAMLLLARGEERRGEMALRSALGAGRMRIVGQHLREALVVAGAGGVLGVAMAVVGIHVVAGIVEPTLLPDLFKPEVDPRVLLFAVGIVLLSAVAFGLAPALQSLRQNHAEAIKAGGTPQAGGGRRGSLVLGGLVALEIAFCLVALGGGSVLVQTFRSVRAPDPGFEARSLLVVEFGLPHWKYEGPEEWVRVLERLEERVREVPGVLGAGLVSQSLARRHFPEGSPVGRRLRVRGRSREIVGVVGDVQESLVPQVGGALDGAIYIPRAQEPSTFGFLLARVEGDARALADPVRRAFWDVDPDVTVHASEPHAAYARRFTAPLDVVTPMVSVFGLFALLLAALGTYGVVSHAVARRRHEFGVRLAVGAQPGALVRRMAGRGLVMAVAGLAVGAALLVPVVRIASATLQGFALSEVDTTAVVVVGVVLLLVTVLACVLPALRAGRVDPATVLRVE